MSLSTIEVKSLQDRVEKIPVDINNIKEIILYYDDQKIIIPNQPNKSLSLKIFIGVINDGIISRAEAKKALEFFGRAFREEAKNNPGTHPNIDLMEKIVAGKIKKIKISIIPFQKKLPFSLKDIKKVVQKYPTPIYIYDEKAIRSFARQLKQAFDWVPGDGYKNFFAVKATPNPHIMKILKEEGMGADCSSSPELILADKIGLRGEEIMFSSNNTSVEEYKKAQELGVIINFDDITHLDFYEKNVGHLPELVCFRYNPGELKSGNDIIGNPVDAKYGLTTKQLFEAYHLARQKGVKRFGLHAMIVSNMLDTNYLIDTAELLFDLVQKIKTELNIEIEFVNVGGGLGLAYKPTDQPVNLKVWSDGIKSAYNKKNIDGGWTPLRIVSENGRRVVGPYGYLVTKIIHLSKKYKNYLGVDASMHNLMRPALYGAYHHITILGKEDDALVKKYDVTGSLCENNDKFAIDRFLPDVKEGDFLVIHDVGAHGHAMGFNYNGKLRSAELLLQKGGTVREIRRAETIDDYFSTLNF